VTASREKYSFRLPPELVRRLDATATARHVPRTAIVEAALASFLSPDGSDRIEAAVSRRLDRVTRQLDRLAWHVDLTNETLALFIRFWLTTNPPLPDTAMKAAQAMGRERWAKFIESLHKRMEIGPKLGHEVGLEVGERANGRQS
jgi:predicted transcriptional regulator